MNISVDDTTELRQNHCIIFGQPLQENESSLAVIFIPIFKKEDDNMWVEKKPNGKFKFVERYEDYLSGKIKRVSVTLDKNTAQSRKLAQKTLDEMIQAAYSTIKQSDITLKQLIEAYRKDQAVTVKQSTYKRNYFACDTLMRILGENTIVDRMTAKYVHDQFLVTGKNPGTLNEHLCRFKALIRWGYKNDMVSNISFLDKIDSFKDIPHKEKIQDKFLESEELKLLLDGMQDTVWKLFTQFLALSGLRFGEAAALLKTDIDYKASAIHVTKTYDGINKVTTTPKTSCSVRDVFMQDELKQVCKQLETQMLRRQLMFQLQKPCLYLFSQDGTNLHYYSYNAYLRENAQRILGRIITPHTLRHTHASLLFEKGINIDTISRRLGHENSKVTRNIYLHVTEKLKEKDNEQVAGIKIL